METVVAVYENALLKAVAAATDHVAAADEDVIRLIRRVRVLSESLESIDSDGPVSKMRQLGKSHIQRQSLMYMHSWFVLSG